MSLALAGLLSFALTTWLVAQDTLQLGSVATLGLISMWLAHGWIRLLRHQLTPSSPNLARGTSVIGLPTSVTDVDSSAILSGLSIVNLNAVRSDGHEILKEVNLEIAPGSIVQITGGSGDGKSLLLRALSDPFSIENSVVQGRVLVDGVDPWSRGNSDEKAPIVRVDPQPILLEGSALNNLTCFQSTKIQDRASRILTHLAHSVDTTDRLTSENRAFNLPLGQQKLLCIARAFLLSPNVYFFDLPEAFLSKYQLINVQEFITAEARRGKIFFIVTEDRALASICDHVLVMQDGKNIDFDKSAALRRRYGSGWKRFVGLRNFDTEDSLKSWLGSQFVRKGDEENKRLVNRIGLNLLTYFCQNSVDAGKGQVIFECMQKEGEFLLRASDNGEPISVAQLAQAKELSKNPTVGDWIPPLVNIMRDSEKVVVPDDCATRSITVNVKTYDPRQLGSK